MTIELLDQEFGDDRRWSGCLWRTSTTTPRTTWSSWRWAAATAHPVVLRHFVEHPQRVLADSYGPEGGLALDILGSDGARTIVTLHTPSL